MVKAKPYRQLFGQEFCIASHNDGKCREIEELLRPFGCRVQRAAALGLPEPDETGDSFIANAELKARAAVERVNLPALADDSGLAVDALLGAPGIYSARWAARADGRRDFGYAMEKLERKLKAARAADPNLTRHARFVCALSLAWPDGHVENFEGTVEGKLIWPPRGSRGFGYDPIFVPTLMADDPNVGLTFGEMDESSKQLISHRNVAFRKLIAACFHG